MSSEKDLNTFKILKNVAWPMGIWPLSDNYFSLFRTLVLIAIQVSKKNFIRFFDKFFVIKIQSRKGIISNNRIENL